MDYYQILNKLPREHKIGQIIMAQVRGDINLESPEFAEVERMFKDLGLGGVLVTGGLGVEAHILIQRLQRVAPVPLLVAADLERGAGQQFRDLVEFPCAMALGATGSDRQAYQVGQAIAEQARMLGIHLVFAPVMDICLNPRNPVINTRAFGENVKLVSTMGAALIRGLQREGVLACAKHFPGHGATSADSHLKLPVLQVDKLTLRGREFLPFEAAIGESVAAIMTGHLCVPALVSEIVPVSCHPQVVTELLRNQLRHAGLIVCDALLMKAITEVWPEEEAALRALEAGSDILLAPSDPRKIHARILETLDQGKLRDDIPAAAARRVVFHKSRLRLFEEGRGAARSLVQEPPDHARVAAQTAELAITLLRDDPPRLPLALGSRVACLALCEDEPAQADVLDQALQAYRAETKLLRLWNGQEPAEQAAVERDLAAAEVLLVTVFSQIRAYKGGFGLNRALVEVVNRWAAAGRPVVLLCCASPYVLLQFPQVQTIICAYGGDAASVRAAVDAALGDLPIRGQIPVTVPGLFLCGHGLSRKGRL